MEFHICNTVLPKFNSIFNYKIENYGKRKKTILKNSVLKGNKNIWKTKYVTINFDKDELNNFPSEKLEALKRTLYSLPGLGNEEDFIEYQYHYKDYINNNDIEQNNLILFENAQKSQNSTLNILDTTSLGDIKEYPLLNPSFYISPSIVSSVHISFLTSQIKIKYNPDFTNLLLIKNIISQSGLNILETISSPYIKTTYGNVINEKISTTTYDQKVNGEIDNDDDFINDFLTSSKDGDQENLPNIKYYNKYNKKALLELSCILEENKCSNRITSGICNPECDNCILWLKNYISQYFFDQIDIQSIQFIQQPWIELNDEINNNSNVKSKRFSMIFHYHESAEQFIFDEINEILNEININVHRIQKEYLSFSNQEKEKRNSLKGLKNLENITDIKKISLHSISFILPKLNRASEAMYLESKLLKISGIKSPIKFDFMKKQCTIIYNSYEISIKDIVNEMRNYHFDASTISESFRRLTKEEEKQILTLPLNNINDITESLYSIPLDNKNGQSKSNLILSDQDETEKTEICYNSDSDEINLISSNDYAHSVNSSTSSTEYMGNSSDNIDIANNSQAEYIELKNQINKKSKNVMDKNIILHAKVEKCFSICSILTILSFITPYIFVWINYITNNSYSRLNLHLECIIVFLLSIPVQFYYGQEIHSIALNILKTNECECNFSNNDIDINNSKNMKGTNISANDKYSQCPLHSKNTKKNNRMNRTVVLSFATWIIWGYSTLGVFIRLLQMYTNNSKYESSHVYHEYYETSSLLITCYYVKKLLELSAKQYTINNISQFMHLQMKKAVLLTPIDKALSNCNTINEKSLKTEWIESIVDINSLKEGDIIKVLPKNRIPYNGSIVFGKTRIDESMINGNTNPVTKSKMDRVMSGTMNIESSIYIKILDATNDCTFYSMINFIEDVQLSKNSFHIFTDCIYKYLVPIFIFIAAMTLFFWTFIKINNNIDGQAINEESLKTNYQVEFGIIFAISVLVITCPFTIEFSFPIAVSIASKIAMKYGILIKDDALTFKKLSLLDIVVFNKDQVITNGNPSVVEVIIDKNFNRFGDDELFYEILKSLQRYSTNIYAKCIKSYLKKVEMAFPNKGIASSWNVIFYQETEGYNIIAKIRLSTNSDSDILDICMGCEKWMIKQKCIFSMNQDRLSIWTERGYSIIYIAINKVVVGMLGIHDNVRDGTKSLIQCLKDQYHIEPWLLSSDNEASTVNTAKQIGIDDNHCLYNVLPSEKQEKIKWLQNNYILNSNSKRNNFKITNNSFDRELDDYRIYQEDTNNFDPFNPHGSTNIFSNYNVIAPIPSMSRDSLMSESSSHATNSKSNEVQIKVEHEEKDNDHLIHQNNEINQNMVAYIGNDINDSEVFSTADVGLCLGILNDISLDSSMITTIYQDVQCINKLLHLTKYIINYSYTTIIYILLLQVLLLPVATGLLYPYTWLNPIWILINLVLNVIIHYYRTNNLKKVNF